MEKLTMKQIVDALDVLEDDCIFDVSNEHCIEDNKKRTKMLVDVSKVAQAKALLISLMNDESPVFNNIERD
jgi:hypothetical protein